MNPRDFIPLQIGDRKPGQTAVSSMLHDEALGEATEVSVGLVIFKRTLAADPATGS